MERVITANWHVEKAYTLSVYQQHGGFKSLKKVFGMERGAVVPELIKSNLRGRGGAGFPVGAKWSFLPKGTDVPKYLVVNADEGEPGTFKDRFIMERDPHRLMEGCIIAGYTLGLKAAYIYVRGELVLAAQRMEAAIAELYAAGLLGKNILGSGLNFDIYVHRGAGAYICGEETALIESLEGKTGQPRLKPPFPAVVGVFGCPTVVNNVESIACVPLVLERGAEWWAAQGSEKNGGPKIVQISGKVKRPGTYEVPNGISLRDIVFSDLYGGGPLDEARLRRAQREALRHHGRHERRHRDGRHRLRRSYRGPHRPVLPPRVLRTVHPLPRRHGLGLQDPRPHRGRRREACRGRPAARHREQHPRQHHLPLWRRGGHVDRRLPASVPRRVHRPC